MQLNPIPVACCYTPVYFFAGAGIGAANFHRGLLSAAGQLGEEQLGLGNPNASSVLPAVGADAISEREVLGNPIILPDWYEMSHGLFFVSFSAAILFAIMAFSSGSNNPVGASSIRCRRDAYGMFLVHYPIVLWLQYWLFDLDCLPSSKRGSVRVDRRLELGLQPRRYAKFRGRRTCFDGVASGYPDLMSFALGSMLVLSWPGGHRGNRNGTRESIFDPSRKT